MLTPNTILQNRYQVLRQLGAGGMGAVYLASDLRLGARRVVVKENIGGDPHQFQTEASILAQLSHLNLPRVSDHFQGSAGDASMSDTGVSAQYLVMDYVEGENLESRLSAQGILTERLVLLWFMQILDAVEYLHGNGIIHRDIKPGNIIITPQDKAMLVDFGIAKVYRPGKATTAGARAFTPGFSAPEQYHGGTDPRSDIYSLGALLYALLSGGTPPDAVSLMMGNETLPPLQTLNPLVKSQTENTIRRAMAFKQAERFQSIDEMRRALTASASATPISATRSNAQTMPATLTAPAAAVSKPRGLSVAAMTFVAIVGLVVGLACLGGMMWWANNAFKPLATQSPIAFETETSAIIPVRPSPVSASTTPTLRRPTVEITLPPAPPTWTPTRTRTPPHVMQFVPDGPFTRGSTDADIAQAAQMCGGYESGCASEVTRGSQDEKSQARIQVAAFWIDRYEVTNRQYAECVQSGPCRSPAQSTLNSRAYFGNSTYDEYPVVWVTWDDAATYCNWRGFRLPTEAEWEKAARGPSTGAQDVGRVFPWGASASDVETRANYRTAGTKADTGFTTRVGNFVAGASPYGVFDLAGNVWEWASDWYSETYSRDAPSSNPQGPPSGTLRVIRGGSWNSFLPGIRTATRAGAAPDRSFFDAGFRCAGSRQP